LAVLILILIVMMMRMLLFGEQQVAPIVQLVDVAAVGIGHFPFAVEIGPVAAAVVRIGHFSVAAEIRHFLVAPHIVYDAVAAA
jgi:hypothetical protein